MAVVLANIILVQDKQGITGNIWPANDLTLIND
jgi:hypothetical protein